MQFLGYLMWVIAGSAMAGFAALSLRVFPRPPSADWSEWLVYGLGLGGALFILLGARGLHQWACGRANKPG